MTAFYFRTTASIAALVLSGSAAFAEVTAQQVWDAWKIQFGASGALTTENEALNAGVLTVTGLSVDMEDETGSASTYIESLTFTEQGDGTVLITQSPDMTMDMTTVDLNGGTTSLSIVLTSTDAEIIASGTPDAMNLSLSATRYEITVSDLTTDGEAMEGSIVIGLNNVAGGYTTTGTTSPIDAAGEFSAASVDLFADLTDETGENIAVTGKSEGLVYSLTGSLAFGDGVTPANTFEMGSAAAGTSTAGATSLQISAQGAEGGSFSIAMAGTTTTFDVSGDTMAFDTSLTGLAVNMMSADLPMPIDLALDAFGIGMAVPAAPTDAPAPFGLRFAVEGLTANEEIWSMIDPGQLFSRDPVTAVIDVTGTAITAINIYDPEAQAAQAATGAPPGELHSLDIGELRLAAAGADVSATGGLTFDNTDLATFGGMPKPVGAIDININGANALMDNLVAMGLIPQDQVMMARMMIGMFAVPTGDDSLTSKIEFTPEGGILANGQQIQ
jgi:hypothetical protein